MYYGGGTENHLGEADTVSVPLLMRQGEADEFNSKDAQRKIKDVFADNTRVEIHAYPGCSHAFARHTGTRYDASADALANGRTADFFARHLY